MPELRTYQREDVDAVLAAHGTHQCVIGRAATGLGKAVEIAALAHHYAASGRVMVLVDVSKLVRQLAATIQWYTGMPPGVEMADQRAANGGGFLRADPIIVSTVQTQYSGEEGNERFRQFDPSEFSAVLLDECELFLAPKSRGVVEWYRSNPNVRVFGCTATPMRSDGVAMAELFDHVAYDRDILWGINEGYLVPARQAFVRVSIDFSTLKVRKGDDGEADYSDAEIADRINNEQTLVELAKGIMHVAEGRRSIVVCPDVASAKAVAHYLDAERPGAARCVYGEMDDQARDDAMNAHQRGEFQFLTSVMLLTKGYDDPGAVAVFVCRKTRSRRLYQQIVGRVLRPAAAIAAGLGALPDARSRRSQVVTSAKPEALVVNMVGIEDHVRDMTIHDILGVRQESDVIERAKRISEETGADAADALSEAEMEIDEERESARLLAEVEAKSLDDEEAARIRRRFDVQATVDVEWRDGLGDTRGGMEGSGPVGVPAGQLGVLRKAKIPEDEIARLSPDAAAALSREVVRRWKLGLCSYKQAKCLQRAGYTKGELHDMTYEAASEAIGECRNNGWRRPSVNAGLAGVA